MISKTDTTYYNYGNGLVDYGDLTTQNADSLKIWISSVEQMNENNLRNHKVLIDLLVHKYRFFY